MPTRRMTFDELKALTGERHAEYWQERFTMLEDALNKTSVEYAENLKRQYLAAMNGIDKELAAWYTRFARNEDVSLYMAKKMLNSDEMYAWKMDVWEYIAKGETLNYTDQWKHQLESASARAHINRLEALKLQMQQQIEEAYAYEEKNFSKWMAGQYTESYWKTAFTIQKGLGAAWDFAGIDTNKVGKILAKPWAADGKAFSARRWDNKERLVRELNNVLTQGTARGSSYQEMTDELVKRMNAKYSSCDTLVKTEAAYFSSAAQKDCLTDLGVEQYEIVATLDSRTSDICRHLDGKVFKMSDFMAGVTAPPFHCRCRSTTCPYFEDFNLLDARRAARGEDGKTYYVPADTTYKQWEKAFGGSGSKNGFNTVML